MTSIVFHDGMLVADQKHLIMLSPFQTYLATKIFKSSDGQFYFAYTGPTIGPDDVERMERYSRRIIERSLAMGSRKHPIESVLCGEEPVFAGNGILVTKTNQFAVVHEGEEIRRLDGATHGAGSGGTILATMLMGGCPVNVAMQRLQLVDPLSSVEHDVVYSKRLKQFRVTGVPKCP